jgi:hypothetical protein
MASGPEIADAVVQIFSGQGAIMGATVREHRIEPADDFERLVIVEFCRP